MSATAKQTFPPGRPPAGQRVTRIDVTGPQPYPVLVGHDVVDEVVAAVTGASRVAVVHAQPVATHAARLVSVLERAGLRVRPIEVPDAEAGKSMAVAARCWDELAAAGFTRSDAVVGVGGGAVTDLAGFVAACWLRGVRWVPVPTSLLGMVDAAVGGKTGVNIAAGKNLVGAFHPPATVLCDLSMLETLPAADRTAGLAEVIKCGFIADSRILSLVEDEPDPTPATLRELVERSIEVKARVVSADLRESGQREILNYGHTFAHAIEQVEGFTWRHGDAVAVGMVFAATLARELGRLDADSADRHRRVLVAAGLPVSYRDGRWPDLLAAMRVDKKSRGEHLRFVLLDEIGAPAVTRVESVDLLERVYREVNQ